MMISMRYNSLYTLAICIHIIYQDAYEMMGLASKQLIYSAQRAKGGGGG